MATQHDAHRSASLAVTNKSEMSEAEVRALEEHQISQGSVPLFTPPLSASLSDD